MQEDEGKNRCKDRFQGEQESGILRVVYVVGGGGGGWGGGVYLLLVDAAQTVF